MHQQLHQWMVDWMNTTIYLPDGVLEKEWAWQGYEEGVRMAFFRIMEELQWMHSVVTQQQMNQGLNWGPVQVILNGYHRAYWDLRVVYAGVVEKRFDQSPGEEEWTLRDTLYHVLETEWAFYGLFRYAFQFAGSKPGWGHGQMPREFINQHFEQEGQFHESVFNGDLSTMIGFYDHLHGRILSGLKTLPEVNLAEMIHFWEPQPMPARFRLIRFESHLRQHTIQAEKTLKHFELAQSEIRHLLRGAAQAFADLESRLIFLPLEKTDLIMKRFETLQQYTGVIHSAWEQ